MATPDETAETAVQAGPERDDGDGDAMDVGQPDDEVDASGEQQEEQEEQEEREEQEEQEQQQEEAPRPGPRATRLQDLFGTTLAHTLARVSWDDFAACYPTAATRSPAALRTVHGAMVRRLGELCAAEFGVVMRQRQVVQRLNELEALGRAARQRRLAQPSQPPQPPRPPHTLPPAVVLDAHLAPQRRVQAADLAARLRASHQTNAARFARLAAQQAEADRLASTLERALADADAAASLLDHRGSDDAALLAELARETRTAEAEMTGV